MRFNGNNGENLHVSDSNLNTLFTPGIYKALIDRTIGFPSNIFCDWIFVIAMNYGDNYGAQLAIGMAENKIAQRYCRNNVWSEWKEFATID